MAVQLTRDSLLQNGFETKISLDWTK